MPTSNNFVNIILVISLLIINSAFLELIAQNPAADNMKDQLLLCVKEDTVTVNLLNNIAYNLYPIDIDNAFAYSKKAEELSNKLNFKNGQAMSNNIIGIYHYMKGNYPQGLEYFQKTLNIYEELNNKSEISTTLSNIGVIHLKECNYNVALDYFQKSILVKKEIGDKLGISKSLNNIGNAYGNQLKYMEAMEYYEKSLEISTELGDKQGISSGQNNIGLVYTKLENYDKAIEYYEKSLKLKEELGNKFGICLLYSNISEAYFYKKDYNSAIHFSLKGLELAKNYNFLEIQKDIYLILAQIYENTNKYKKAYESHLLHKSLNDSIFNAENTKKITELAYQHKYEKERQEIELRKQEEQKNIVKAKYRRHIFYVLFLSISIILTLRLRIATIKSRAEKKILLKEIEFLRSEAFINMESSSGFELNDQLDRGKIESATNGAINDSDWSVLHLLCENPTFNNREISEQISLSVEGVRSSLKKMYRIFDLQNTNENQRMALVINAYRISKIR